MVDLLVIAIDWWFPAEKKSAISGPPAGSSFSVDCIRWRLGQSDL